jgi:electron transport complex protein RnfC
LERKKETESKRIVSFPEPEMVAIFLSQHAGRRADPLVKSGDKVRVGQKIGEAAAFISAPVHSSVSGKVISLEERVHPASQEKDLAIIIENNGENQLDSSIQPLGNFEELTAETLFSLLGILRN